jgi:hypothetical protein
MHNCAPRYEEVLPSVSFFYLVSYKSDLCRLTRVYFTIIYIYRCVQFYVTCIVH